jgi:hypothetical protein
MSEIDFNNAIPSVKTYGNVGNPFKSVHEEIQKNIKSQNELNNKHGGKRKTRKGRKSKKQKRRRTRKGGQKISPSSIVVPQAPTMGGMKVTPNSGNHLSKIASQILVNSKEQAKYDNMVGGKRKRKQSLKSKLERMLRF